MRLFALVAFTSLAAACGGAASAPRRATLPPAVPYVVADAPPARAGSALTQADVAADLSVLFHAIDDAYGGRRFVTGGTMWSFQERLETLAADGRTADALCTDVAGALTMLLDPRLYASLDDAGARCVPTEGTAGGYPSSGWRIDGIAAHETALFTVRRENGPVVLGIRAFAPAADSGWTGLDRAVDEAAHAPSVIVDLRSARGDDPEALLPLVAVLTGVATPHPVATLGHTDGATADALRAAAARVAPPRAPPRALPASWRELAGDEGPATTPPERELVVLVGDGCEEACEVVTRMLATYGHASVHGAVGSEHRMPTGEPGLLVLPRSHLRVHVPTSYVVASPRIARATGERMFWFDRGGQSTPIDVPDPLPLLVARSQARLEGLARVARFVAAPPPPCSTVTPIASEALLDAPARAKLHGSWGMQASGGSLTVEVDLPAAQATPWLRACPGITTGFALGDTPRSPTRITAQAVSFEALSRVLRADVVHAVAVEPPVHEEPNVATR